MHPEGKPRSREPADSCPLPGGEVGLYAQWERSAGRSVRGLEGQYRIVYQGKRNGGPGPDYLGAALAFPDGSLRRGDVEIHLRWDGWRRHRHRWDPRYRQVILHVIAAGPLKAVSQDQWRVVPTVPLPRDPSPVQPLCELVPGALDGFAAQDDFLRSMAAQRWWHRLADWHARSATGALEALARRLGPDHHRLELVRRWMARLPEEADLLAFLADVVSPLPLGSIGPVRRELPGRVVCLSALAFTYHHRPSELWRWSLADVRRLLREVGAGGFSLPTRPFLLEVVGNWLLPLGGVKMEVDRFEEWYHLPLGWTYGRVRRHVERLSLQRPVTFGQQQGLLEWIESLCQPVECAWCPVAGAADEI